MEADEIVSAYREQVAEEGEYDETGGTLGKAEREEVAIRASEPEDDIESVIKVLEDMPGVRKLVVNQTAEIVTGSVTGVRIERLG